MVIKLEMESMQAYKEFKSGRKVFAVKFDGRHNARLVADGHLTSEPVKSIHCGVV